MVYPQVRITWILHQGDTGGERVSVAELILCICGYDNMLFLSCEQLTWTFLDS